MIKLIATDVDGTLVADGSCDINPEYYSVIKTLLDRGIYVAAASGRQEDSLITLFEPIRDRLYFISNNGASLATVSERMYLTAIDPALLQELLEDCRNLSDCEIIVTGVDACFYQPGASEDFLHLLKDEYHFTAYEIGDPQELPPIVKVAIYHDPRLPHPAEPLIRKWQGRLNGVVSGKEWVDFVALNVNKGNALRMLQEKLGVTPEETMAFGDQLNDLAMLGQAVHSFAVGGARAEVKAAAAYVAPARESDGVLQVLKKLVENNGVFDREEFV